MFLPGQDQFLQHLTPLNETEAFAPKVKPGWRATDVGWFTDQASLIRYGYTRRDLFEHVGKEMADGLGGSGGQEEGDLDGGQVGAGVKGGWELRVVTCLDGREKCRHGGKVFGRWVEIGAGCARLSGRSLQQSVVDHLCLRGH